MRLLKSHYFHAFIAIYLFFALCCNVSANPTLTCGGRIVDADDTTSPDGGTWSVYDVNDASETASGIVGEYALGYWAGEVGAFLNLLGINDDLVSIIELETDAGSSSHRGYYSVMDHTLTNNDPAEFDESILRNVPVPVPSISGNDVSLTWDYAIEDSSIPNIIGYNVYRSVDGLTFVKANIEVIPETNYIDVNYPVGTLYYAIGLVYRGNPLVTGRILSANSIAITEIDFDNDGIADLDEIAYGTLPNDSDTDDDGLPDGWEISYDTAMDPTYSDRLEDPDLDGFNNLAEFLAQTDPGSNASYPTEQIQYHVFVDAQPSSIGQAANGTTNDPFDSISEALDVAHSGSIIKIAVGVYYENITISNEIDIQGSWRSNFNHRWNYPSNGLEPTDDYRTIIDGNNNDRCVRITSASNLSIDGLTIQNGEYSSGAGIYINSPNVSIANCIFKSNYAHSYGGGLHIGATANIINCLFENNYSRLGGGLSVFNDVVVNIEKCIFKENFSEFGGGIFFSDYGSSSHIRNCKFYNNQTYRGGGIFNVSSSPTIEGCIFVGNTFRSDFTGTYVGGGGICNETASPEIINCTFYNNSAGLYGGALFNTYSSYPTVKNSIIWDNSAGESGNEIYNEHESEPTFSFCDIRFSGGSGSGWDATLGIDAGSNIDINPLFVNSDGIDNIAGNEDDNLHLGYGSPCINSGDSNGTDFNDMGAYPAATVGSSADFALLDDARNYILTFYFGGSILIEDGNYILSRQLISNTSISLIGEETNTPIITKASSIDDLYKSSGHFENLKIIGDGFDVTDSRLVLFNCSITEAGQAAFFIGSQNEGLISNCLISESYDGIRLGSSTKQISIINNTISNNSGHGIYLMDYGADPAIAPVITNNIIANNSEYGIYEDYPDDKSIIAVVTYNSFFNNSYGDYHDHTQQVYTGADAINQFVDNGVHEVDNNIDGAPLFIGGNPFDYHLQPDSPCIDSGDSLSAPPDFPDADMDRELRPVNAVYDIGADEYLDSDGDNMPDSWELKWFGNLNQDELTDYDGDGLLDRDELRYGANPELADSDADGFGDKEEALAGTDPTDPSDFPTILKSLKKGFNLVSIPSDVSNRSDLKDWLPLFGGSTEIDKVMVYDFLNRMFVTMVPGDDSNPSFILLGGEGIIVHANQDKPIYFASSTCTPIDLKQGFNLVGFTCPPDGYTAFQLLNEIGTENVMSVQRFNPENGKFETAGFDTIGQINGIDFAIISGEGYYLYMKQDVFNFSL